MTTEEDAVKRRQGDTMRVVEVGIRLAIVVGLAVWCFQILRPFLSTIVWAMIIAAALHPAYSWLQAKLNLRRGTVSLLFTIAVVLALMTPVLMLSGTMVESARDFAAELEGGDLQIPPPPERVKSWPVVGEQVHGFWQLASENLGAAATKFENQIKAAGSWLISTAAGAGLGILQFAAALVVSGIFLAYSEGSGLFARNLGRRLAGPRGEGIAEMASTTVHNVAQGVLGVAIIQSIMAGIGFMLADVPGAGLWTMLVLIMATVQLPASIIPIASIFYVASVHDVVPTVIYGVWMVLVGLSDNVLRPLLMGRGGTAPTAVVFLGAIGGFILQGIVGLFVGAVVLVLSYKLFMMWYLFDDPEAFQKEFDAPEDFRDRLETAG